VTTAVTTVDAEGAPRRALDHRLTVTALALALAVSALAVAGGAVAIVRSGSTGNEFLVWFVASLPLGVAALMFGRYAEWRVVDVDGSLQDEERARLARKLSVVGIVLAGALAIGLAVWSSWDGLVDVQTTFFSLDDFDASFSDVWGGFKLNVAIFVTAEILVLLWALMIVSVRQLPGPAAAPLRWLAIAYVDIFRGLPALVTIYLVGFGLPLTDLPILSDPSVDFLFIHFDEVEALGIVAITLVYGAYVAEVYRAGIESVHWSQTAAARGLGLSRGRTLRAVVLPQAIRRVIPPLMNDFIGLQKDTALLSVLAVPEGFNQARIYAGNHFNLSSVTLLGLLFLVVTVPMTRLTDYLVRRDQRRTQAVMA
jgi:polar amino acid transport system permease protein